MSLISPRTAYLVLAVILAVSVWVVIARSDRLRCETENILRAEVNERTSEINAIARSQRILLINRLDGDVDLIAEGVGQTRKSLGALKGVRAEAVDQVDCPSFP